MIHVMMMMLEGFILVDSHLSMVLGVSPTEEREKSKVLNKFYNCCSLHT